MNLYFKTVDFANFHALFWGNATGDLFSPFQRNMRLMESVKKTVFCWELFKQYISSCQWIPILIIAFHSRQHGKFSKSELHCINTRYARCYPRWLPEGCVLCWNQYIHCLPSYIKLLNHNIKEPKPALKDYFLAHF